MLVCVYSNVRSSDARQERHTAGIVVTIKTPRSRPAYRTEIDWEQLCVDLSCRVIGAQAFALDHDGTCATVSDRDRLGFRGGTFLVEISLSESMKILAAIALVTLAFVPAATATQATDLTGNWNAKFTRTAPDGQTQSITFTFHFKQKGKVLEGTIGPEPARQWKVEKGVVDGAKVSFQVQQPDGPLRSFALTHAKGRLQGTQKLAAPDGRSAEVTVDAERAK